MSETYTPRQFHVVMQVEPWLGDGRSEPDVAVANIVSRLTINGHDMGALALARNWVPLPVEGVLLQIDGFLSIVLNDISDDAFALLDVDENDWLEGSTRASVGLPVASLTVEEAPRPVPVSRDRGGDRGPANVGI
jgi:hypothetical protein